VTSSGRSICLHAVNAMVWDVGVLLDLKWLLFGAGVGGGLLFVRWVGG